MNKTKICKNQDNDWLMPLGGAGFTIGLVDEVNGRGAKEVPGFVPTRHELVQLVKFWVEEALDYDFNEAFIFGQYCSAGSRRSAFAWLRIGRIADVLGREQVKEAIEGAYAEFRKNRNQRDWEIFMNGDSEDWRALQEEVRREVADHLEVKRRANNKD